MFRNLLNLFPLNLNCWAELVKALLELLLGGTNQIIEHVQNFLKAIFLGKFKLFLSDFVHFHVLLKEEATSLFHYVNSSFFKEDFLPEEGCFVNTEEVCVDKRAVVIFIVIDILQIKIMLTIFVKNFGQILLPNKFRFHIKYLPCTVHSNQFKIIKTAREINLTFKKRFILFKL